MLMPAVSIRPRTGAASSAALVALFSRCTRRAFPISVQ
jgi:hypothetical protein